MTNSFERSWTIRALSNTADVLVDGDPELLRRAIENVIRNAIRYSPRDSALEISLRTVKDRARVTVRDHGPGVPENTLPLLFEPFYRVESDRDRASGGAGLGLSIARRAIELHRGSIKATNANPGLCVEIEIPLGAAPQIPAAVAGRAAD